MVSHPGSIPGRASNLHLPYSFQQLRGVYCGPGARNALLSVPQACTRRGTMKKLSRRRFLRLAASAAALPGTSRLARAQAYPARPVRLISSFAAGGPNDLLARLIGQWLSERLGQPFIIDNRPGAGGNIGTEVAAKAPPDGY